MSDGSHLLNLPPEIWLRVLYYLFSSPTIAVRLASPEEPGELPLFRMNSVPVHAQILRVCKQLYQQSRPILYSNNIFSCSEREGLKLLLQSVGPDNFPFIKHIIIDWEQLQDLAWSLAKEDHNNAMSGLETVDIATWRTRLLGGTSSIYRAGKNYERQLCQSAIEICAKHRKLNIVAQRLYSRFSQADHFGRTPNQSRVKWRFIISENDLRPDEVVLPIEEEFMQLEASLDGQVAEHSRLEMIDPF